MKPTYTIERRRNYNGVPCVAPFINGFNVWDIPEELWGHAVGRAIQRAYEIGYADAIRRMQADRYWNEAHALLGEYHKAQEWWQHQMGEPYVSGFGKD